MLAFNQDKAPADPFFYMMTLYLIPFAALLLTAELGWHTVLKYFEFAGYMHGKGFLLIFIALLLFNPEYPLDTAVSIYLTFTGLLNLVQAFVEPALDTLTVFKKDSSLGSSESEGD